MPRVNDDTNDHLCVAEGHATKEDVVIAEWNHELVIPCLIDEGAALARGLDAPVKLVDQVVRSINVERRLKIRNAFNWVVECIP